MSLEQENEVRREKLSPVKRALLERWKRGNTKTGYLITPRPMADTADLSFAQQRLWFLEQLHEPDLPAYNILTATRLQGALNVPALTNSLNKVIQRHEVLRASFRADETGRPFQQFAPSLTLSIPITDLSQQIDVETAVRTTLTHEAQTPFDLTRPPLLRVRLLRLAAQEHILLVNMHHIISDGWSTGVFTRDLTLMYADVMGATVTTLPDLPVQYADFAYWQRQQLQGELLHTQLAYWKNHLKGTLPVLELPTDHPRPAVQGFEGRLHTFHLTPELTTRLKTVAQAENCSLFMLLLAAFNVLLYRYTGQEEILVGSPIANRNQVELEELIGFFVNTLVFRNELSGDLPFHQFLQQVRQVTLGAYANQDLPFDRLVEELRPERNLSYNPIFQVIFALQNTPIELPPMPGLSATHLTVETGTTKFDMTWLLEETADFLTGQIEYSPNLFEAATISRMAGHFQTLLTAIVADPAQTIGALPLLTAVEQDQLLLPNNDARYFPPQFCIHHLFAQQAAQNPDFPALTVENQTITYQELNTQANQLAHYLQSLGIGPGVLVGICLERSLEMVVSILAILKAGGGYVPLDPTSPPDRLAFILQDAAISVLLTQTFLLPDLPEKAAKHVICLDKPWNKDTFPISDPINEVKPDDVAYAIYTSGSTGNPKGVLITHYNVVRLFQATDHWYHFGSQDVWTLFHSYAFDFSVWEIWGALLYGGRLVVVPYWVSRSPETFYELLCREGVTVLNQTPSAFRQLIQAEEKLGGADERLQLRLVIFGGEALELNSLRPWFHRHGDERPLLVNMYGITETTVHVTYRPIYLRDLETAPGSVIGRPIPDLQLVILDQNQQPVPVGVPGEIYVGGAGVALGYLNRPELTAARFIEERGVGVEERGARSEERVGSSPFALRPSPFASRLYRTGDLARFLPDGDVEYLGRIDHQVKIRGFRIELGEIEATLFNHSSVRAAMVMAHQMEKKEKQLLAYVIPHLSQPVNIGTLRHYLKTKLPDYMIPAHFILLEEFPLTTNGKIDRRALPLPGEDRPDLNKVYVPPQTAVQQTLATIWGEVLQLNQVGLLDNFFEIGGDSIRTIQVLYQARERGILLSLQQLFQYQTLAELAKAVETAEQPALTQRTAYQPFSLISPADRTNLPVGVVDAYPLTRLQAGMLFHTALEQETAVYHNVTSLRIQAVYDPKRMETAVANLIARHPVLRTAFDLHQFSQPLQLVYRNIPLPLHTADLRQLSPAEQEAHLAAWQEAEKKHQFQWEVAPLFRLHLHILQDELFQFGLTEHHAIIDGWSVATLFTELFQLYTGTTPLPRPATTFAEFVALEQETVVNPEQESFWLEKLQECPALMLPRWPAEQKEQQGMWVRDIPLSGGVSEGLRQMAQATAVPLKTLLLASHLRVMSVVTGQTDVVTGIVLNGRPETADAERTLGLFLNTVPLRMALTGGTWADLVRATFAAEQEVLAYRRYPLANIQRQHGQPLFETIFNFIHFHVYQNLADVSSLKILDEQFYGVTNYPFSVEFEQHPATGHLTLIMEYDAAEFSQAQINTIGGYYVQTLTAMANEPFARYETHSPLSVEELSLLRQWNETAVEFSTRSLCLPALFEAQVAKTPQAVAVQAGGQQLTYDELNRRANQLAHHLRTLGVGPETIVGLWVNRSLEMLIGLWGILKAGAAYLPLDTSYPIERLRFMVQDAETAVLLTTSTQQAAATALTAQLPTAVSLVYLDNSLPDMLPIHNPRSPITPENLAYIIYTSGSTGQPKGVMVLHRGVVNYATAIAQKYQLQPSDRVLQFAAFSFDVAAEEIFPTLLTGGTVVLRPDDILSSYEDFSHFVHTQRLTVLNLPAQYWQGWTADLVQTKTPLPPHLRLVVAGSEEVATDSLHLWQTWAGSRIRWINAYGPTEATIGTTFYEPDNGPLPAVVPIGKPIANTQVYVLDHHRQPAPVGTAGELYIAGAGLARGYWHQSGLTAERFIEEKRTKDEGRRAKDEDAPRSSLLASHSSLLTSRLYRTGDLARFRPDGNLEFLGRADEQVKIRGFRVELGEIEAVLRQHSAVREAVVLAQVYGRTGKQLVAYVVPRQKQDSLTELRSFLQEKLPAYMVPTHFIWLPSLPLLPNGKINRRVLRESAVSTPPRTFVPPRTPTEETLVTIWAEVLGLPSVSIHDNFFELGGHSLLITQIISRIFHQSGIQLPLRALFDAPTIAELAVQLVQAEAALLDEDELAQLLAELDEESS